MHNVSNIVDKELVTLICNVRRYRKPEGASKFTGLFLIQENLLLLCSAR